MKKQLIFHPPLFAIFPTLFFYSYNKEQLTPKVLLIPSLVTLSCTLLLWFLLNLIFKNKNKSGWFVSLSLLLFFSYGHFRNLIGDYNTVILGKFNINSDRILLTLYGLLLLLLIYFVKETRGTFHLHTQLLNITALFLVLFTLAKIIPYEMSRKLIEFDWDLEEGVQAEPNKNYPDIYYIILDNYARADTLKEFYGHNNSDFVNFLTDLGFYVASESATNYPKTSLSLGSSLNMKHLTYLTDKLGKDNSDLTVAFNMMQDFKVWRFLKQKGYKFVYFGNWWEHTQVNKFADTNINYRFGHLNPTQFSGKLLETTILHPLAQRLSSNPLESPLNINYVQAVTTLYTFKELAKAPTMPGPKFVFAHFIVPHLPYVFGRDGEVFLGKGELFTPQEYVDQLIFVNKKLKKLVQEMLTKSDPQPIIILQSDEGPFNAKFRNQGDSIDWRKLSDDDLKLHMRILNAYYLPDEETRKMLYPSITPVNSFRIVFNCLFKTDYELLDDTVYITPDTKHPYQFIDVTNMVK